MESGDGNAKRGCGRWMEDCGRGAAVEQLTARGMEEYQSPQWGAIAFSCGHEGEVNLSIPAMGGNRAPCIFSTMLLTTVMGFMRGYSLSKSVRVSISSSVISMT